jgi:hypothetical protein
MNLVSPSLFADVFCAMKKQSVKSWKRILRSVAVCLTITLGFAPSATADSATTDDDGVLPRPPACEDGLELVAIVCAVEDPTRSMALVGAKRSRLVQIGSWLGERQVLDLGPRSLVLGPVEDPCIARLTERSTRRQATPRRRRSRPRRR